MRCNMEKAKYSVEQTQNSVQIPSKTKTQFKIFAYLLFFCLIGIYMTSGFAGAS